MACGFSETYLRGDRGGNHETRIVDGKEKEQGVRSSIEGERKVDRDVGVG